MVGQDEDEIGLASRLIPRKKRPVELFHQGIEKAHFPLQAFEGLDDGSGRVWRVSSVLPLKATPNTATRGWRTEESRI